MCLERPLSHHHQWILFKFTANDEGRFKEELAPVTIKVKKQDVQVTVDEHPRPQTTIEGLNKLATLFKKDGTVTAGNASVSFVSSINQIFLECSFSKLHIYFIGNL